MPVELPPPPNVTPWTSGVSWLDKYLTAFKRDGVSIPDQLTMQKQSTSNIAHYEGIAQGVVPGTGGTQIAKAGSIPMGAFGGGAKSFAGPSTTGGSGLEGPTPESPTLGSFAMLPIFAIGAVILLIWLKKG